MTTHKFIIATVLLNLTLSAIIAAAIYKWMDTNFSQQTLGEFVTEKCKSHRYTIALHDNPSMPDTEPELPANTIRLRPWEPEMMGVIYCSDEAYAKGVQILPAEEELNQKDV